MMTDALLKGLAAQGANMGKTEIRYRGQLNGIVASYDEGQGLHRMRSVERLMVEQAGEAWMNSGRAKDILCGVLACGANVMPPDAIMIVSAVDKYEQTEAFDALPHEEKERIAKTDHRNPRYFTRHDALMAMIQTKDRICVYTHRWKRHLLIGEPDIRFYDQAEFTGRPDEVLRGRATARSR